MVMEDELKALQAAYERLHKDYLELEAEKDVPVTKKYLEKDAQIWELELQVEECKRTIKQLESVIREKDNRIRELERLC